MSTLLETFLTLLALKCCMKKRLKILLVALHKFFSKTSCYFFALVYKRAKIAHAFDEVKRNETNHQTLGNRIAHWLPADLAVWQSLSGRKTVSDLQQHVLRMHILANSDSDADQQLKYQVRDALLASSETLFGSSQSESREALETTAKAHLHEMETIAQQVVQEQGYSYPVKAELVTMPFTERTYEDLTMPAGTYEAIRITIEQLPDRIGGV